MLPSPRAARSPLAGPRTPKRIEEATPSLALSYGIDGMTPRMAAVRRSDRSVSSSTARPIDGRTGEPLAFALLAADKLALSRSPKLHRPHGPYCLRGGCDGCLACA